MKILFVILLLSSYIRAETVLKLSKATNETFARIAAEHSLIFKRKLFDNYYLFELDLSKHKMYKRRISREINLNQIIKQIEQKLTNDPDIEWHEVQKPIIREKRNTSISNKNKTFRYDYLFDAPFHDSKETDLDDEQFDYIYELENRRYEKNITCAPSKFSFNDPGWPKQWYMNDGCLQGHNLNITSAWLMGFTGKGIVVTIIDDGIEKDHDELKDSYDPAASTDLNHNDSDPQPRYENTTEENNNHGTRCAGQVVAKVNNSKCGVGIAYGARIGGIRLLDGNITDSLEAEALTFNLQHIDIFSSSWGPPDDGKTVDGPGTLSSEALIKGIRTGRGGKGTIYVWAAGNGGRHNDNCNCDGYTASIYTITIGGVTYEGLMPAYSEKCSATLASTFSSGSKEFGIVSSDLNNKCTSHHSGTSASAPIAASIIALALEANSNLTWRDIQYLIVHTSDSFKLNANDWQKNGNGKIFSHNYGFGLMNAGRMIEWALKWPLVEKQLKCRLKYETNCSNRIKRKETKTYSIFIKKKKSFSMASDALFIKYEPIKAECTESNLNFLEHVLAHITLKGGIRGQMKINLISPYNTTSNLLELRRKDTSRDGFTKWPFMSVYHWGEQIFGLWRLEIINLSSEDIFLKQWHLELFGVENKII